MPSPAAVSFAPVFTAAPVGLDPVAAAMSQVGLPSPVCGQTAIVPLVNPAVPPAADLLGGPVAIPGWGSLPPRLTKKNPGSGIRGHVGATAGVMAPGTGRGWLLPFPSPEAWASHKFPTVGRMLRCPGGDPVNSLSRKDATFYDLLENNYQSK